MFRKQRRSVPPPPTADPKPSLPLKHLWQEASTETRRKALLTLSRLIAQQLLTPPIVEEVAHEHQDDSE